MEITLHQTDSHQIHDDQWCIVSCGNQLPLCIACLVEHLEDQSTTTVQNRFNLSLLAGILAECEEATRLLREHPLVCQHILDIITDHYTDNSSMTLSVQICVQLMDALQSEEVYVYLLDKFQYQAQNDIDTFSFVVTTLGKLSVISSAYVLTLILSHEHLLIYLLETHARHSPIQDDGAECSLLFLLIHLFDTDILPVVPPRVLPLVEQCLVTWMTSAQSMDLQMNTLALLKRLLNADCCLRDDSESWPAVLMGLKRVFVGKKEVLVTASAQCLIIIANIPRHIRILHRILDSDLSEFLFESLHTINGAQLEAVFSCLRHFTERDQFFKRCHAVYGLESVLRSLDVAMDTQNVTVLVKGFSLLSSILQRQPGSIPLFVNMSAMELTVSVIRKGACCHALQVVLPALTAATALFLNPSVARQQPTETMQTIVEAALTKVGGALWRGEAVSALSSIDITEYQLLDTLLSLLIAIFTSSEDAAKLVGTYVLKECEDIISYFSNHFTACDGSTLKNLFRFMTTLYENQGTDRPMKDLSGEIVSSGLIVQFLMRKSDFRADVELLAAGSCFVEHVLHVLVKEDVPLCQSLPEHIKSGLRQLSLKDSMRETVDGIRKEDTAVALCMIMYFSCLNDSGIFSASHVLNVLEELQTKQILRCTSDQPLMCRFLLYLLAWASSQLDEQTPCSFEIQNVEKAVVQQVSQLPVELWAVPCPHIFLWLFHTEQRAEGPGASLLEHWLLHTKANVPTDGNNSLQSHVISSLFFNQRFRHVLLKLVTSVSEEMSILARKLIVMLIKMQKEEDEQQTVQLLSCTHNEVVSLFQDLFLQSLQPSRHVVNNFLQVIIALIQHPTCEPSETVQNRQIKIIYHVVRYIGTTDNNDWETLTNGMICLHFLSKTTDAEQDRTVVPILLQNTDFVQQLEWCLRDGSHQLSSAALCITAWVASSCSECPVEKPICIRTEFILQAVTNWKYEHSEAVLRILYLSLDYDSSATNTPLSFHRSCSFSQAGQVYTTHELRLLFCHVQQYVCSEEKEIQFCAVQCLLKLMEHSMASDNTLGEHFLHHPWNPQLLHTVLTQSMSSGLDLHIAELTKQIWCEDDSMHVDIAKLVLESIQVTEISTENQHILQTLVQKAKDLCEDQELVDKAICRLASLNDSLSFSQNTLEP